MRKGARPRDLSSQPLPPAPGRGGGIPLLHAAPAGAGPPGLHRAGDGSLRGQRLRQDHADRADRRGASDQPHRAPAARKGRVPRRTDAQRRIWQAAPCYRPSLARRPAHHFFFAAEDFTRYVGYVEAEKRFAQEALREISGKYGSAYADSLAAQPYSGTLDALEHLYGAPLERQSHGQGFLEFFRSRLLPGGLYLMDEPEAALSYVNQLALIYLIQDAVRDGSQFILATHSPILAAIPEAAILEMEEGNLTPRAYEELGLVRFLQHFLHILASADDSDAEQ